MEVKGSSSSRPPIGFLNTSLEIRLQIYRYCLLHKKPLEFYHTGSYEYCSSNWSVRGRNKSLLLVSKQIGSEALEVLYGENVFRIDFGGGEDYLIKSFAEANIGRMRRMEFFMQPRCINYGRIMDTTLWSPILANLTKLSIVAEQPDRAQQYDTVPPFEKVMKKWLEWLRSNLQCIATHLSPSCVVEVDDDDRKEASTVMGEIFPSGYRKVQTLTGDFYFYRNNYSLESSYWEEFYDDNYVDSDAS